MPVQKVVNLVMCIGKLLLLVGGVASVTVMLLAGKGAIYLLNSSELDSINLAAMIALTGLGMMAASLLALILFQYKNSVLEVSKLSPFSIQKAPGSKLLAFVEFSYSQKTVEHTFKPLVADWHHELFEALKAKRTWKARWISVRYRWAFLKAMGLSKVWEAIEAVFGLVKKG